MQVSDFKQVKIGNVAYYEHSNICDVLDISRQTSHTWRAKQLVPQGRKLRGKLLLFTADELAKFIAYAERIEPADVTIATNQMKLALKA